MASYNRVTLLGNLGQDPELRYTKNQTAFTSFNIATTEYRNTADGGKQTITDWHRVTVWGKQAENCSKYLSKGKTVLVEGKLRNNNWEDKNGNKQRTTEVMAAVVQFLNQNDRRGSSSNDSRPRQDFSPNDPSFSNGQQGGSIDEVPF